MNVGHRSSGMGTTERSRIRVSLQVFFLVIVIAGGFLGNLAVAFRKERQENTVISTARDAGLSIGLTRSERKLLGLIPSRVTGVRLSGDKGIPEELIKSVAQFEKLESLDVTLTDVGAGHFAGNSSNPRVTRVQAALCRSLDDNAVAAICRMFPNLESLALPSAAITDRSGYSLSTLRNLRNLNVSDTGIGSEGIIEVLKHCRDLRILDAKRTEISDPAVPWLTSHPSLEHVDISWTRIQPEAMLVDEYSSRLVSITYWARRPLSQNVRQSVKENFPTVRATVGP